MAAVDTSLPSEPTGAAAALAACHAAQHPLKLYGGWFCPFVQRAWITLCEKKIAHQYVEINPYKKEPALLRLNPRGLVPTLCVSGGDAGTEPRALSESLVICEYLDEAYRDEAVHGPPLLPTDAYEKASARLWIDHVASRIVPAFYRLLQHTSDKDYSLDDARRQLHAHLQTLAEQMHPVGPWFLAGGMSLVDISLAPWAGRLWLIDHYKPGGLALPTDGPVWARWRKWTEAVADRQSIKDTWSDDERYLLAYKRYAEDTTNSLVGQATRLGTKLP